MNAELTPKGMIALAHGAGQARDARTKRYIPMGGKGSAAPGGGSGIGKDVRGSGNTTGRPDINYDPKNQRMYTEAHIKRFSNESLQRYHDKAVSARHSEVWGSGPMNGTKVRVAENQIRKAKAEASSRKITLDKKQLPTRPDA